MAIGKGENAADAARRESSQPTMTDEKADTTTGSPDAVKDADNAAFQPTIDRVVMVSRDRDGNPAQSKNFEVVGIPEDAPQEVIDAHWNRAGEAQGAKHYDSKKHGLTLDEMSDEERDERAKTEARELHRINFREELKG